MLPFGHLGPFVDETLVNARWFWEAYGLCAYEWVLGTNGEDSDVCLIPCQYSPVRIHMVDVQ